MSDNIPTIDFPTQWDIVHYPYLDASVRYRLSDAHCAEFDALEWFGADLTGTFLFRAKVEHGTPTENVEHAARLFSGHVKWDGCANFDFHTDECLRHFCSFDDVRKFGTLLEHAYAECARRLEQQGRTWDQAIVPKTWVHSAIDEPVLAKLLEAMRWATDSAERTVNRAIIVQRLVLEAKQLLSNAGLEIETLC